MSHASPLLSLGHVQVAQVPDRGEPGSSGELDFTYLFQLLEDKGYQGFVGCEYRPRGEGDTGGTEVGQGWFFPYRLRWHCLSFTAGDTVEGLSWLRSYWDKRGHPWTGQ